MPDRSEHCPFLNRADVRCSGHFSLDHLQHAFKYCFDRYKACPVYLELLLERRVRRLRDAVTVDERTEPTHGDGQFVQIKIADRYAKPAA